MKTVNKIFLPGIDRQLVKLYGYTNIEEKSILIIGAGTEEIARQFGEHNKEVIIIVEDHENLIQLRYFLKGSKNISARMMEFDSTDFKNEKFDIIYAQASISTSKRNKIVKEIKRILKPEGIFCIGEIVNLKNDVPQYVMDIWKQSGMSPLTMEEINAYYTSRDFEILFEENLSHTLYDFYSLSDETLKENIGSLTEDEQVYHKKILKKMSHEANAYLRLGGEAHMGFKMLILRKV